MSLTILRLMKESIANVFDTKQIQISAIIIHLALKIQREGTLEARLIYRPALFRATAGTMQRVLLQT